MKPKLKWLIAIASVGAFAGIGLGISACENKRKQNNIRKNGTVEILGVNLNQEIYCSI